MNKNLNFRIVSFADDKFTPYSVERLDRVQGNNEIFSIGDHVTNGTKMNGKIERFDLSEDLKSLFIFTDWSGIGMDLESISKVDLLPSQHQIGDKVILNFFKSGRIENCRILNVHFSLGKVRYDISVNMANNEEKFVNTRLYNVDSAFVEKV
jgi:hypothetical protein